MNDNQFDQLLRQLDGDPGDPFSEARHELLEEIMSEPKIAVEHPESVEAEVRSLPEETGRRPHRVLIAAAAVAVVMAIALPVTLLNLGGAGDATAQLALRELPQHKLNGTKNPHFVPRTSDWEWLYVQEDDTENGSVRFGRQDGATMRVAWAVAIDGRLDHVGGEPVVRSREIEHDVQAFGVEAEASQVGRGEFFRLKVPYAGGLLLFSGKGVASFDEFFRAVAEFRTASPEEWIGELPDFAIAPAETQKAAEQMLADVPLPPNLDPQSFGVPLTKDYAALGQDVTWAVTCAYLTAYEKARKTRDEPALAELAEGMGTSRTWHVLRTMEQVSDAPAAIYATAKRMAARDDLTDLTAMYCAGP